MIHIYNRILLSHKKEHIWVSSNEVNEPRAYYIEWSKSEREKQILYINKYVWTLERWYWWMYLQSSSGDADIEIRLMDMVGEGEGGMNWESNIETYITICKIDSQWEFAVCLRELKQGLCINLEEWDGEGGSRGRGHMYTYGWFILMFDRKQQNSIRQLSFN